MKIEEKVEIAKILDELNVDIIEAGFVASSKRDMKSIQEISKNINNAIIASLACLTKGDIDLANEALKDTKKKEYIHLLRLLIFI